MPTQPTQQLVVDVSPVLQMLIGTGIIAVISFLARQVMLSFRFNPEDLKASIDAVKASQDALREEFHLMRQETAVSIATHGQRLTTMEGDLKRIASNDAAH